MEHLFLCKCGAVISFLEIVCPVILVSKFIGSTVSEKCLILWKSLTHFAFILFLCTLESINMIFDVVNNLNYLKMIPLCMQVISVLLRG